VVRAPIRCAISRPKETTAVILEAVAAVAR
jgi:hypothetical protein